MITPGAVQKEIAKAWLTAAPFALSATITHKTQGTFDPTTGTTAETTASQTLKAFGGEVRRDLMGSRSVFITSIYVRSSELTIDVANEDTVVWDGQTWHVDSTAIESSLKNKLMNHPLDFVTEIPLRRP